MCSYDMLDFVVSAVLRVCRVLSISDRFVFQIIDRHSADEQTKRFENLNFDSY